ncbi:MAG: hypothetical protein H6684_00795 [Deltaproteobacteria bacterium]|nr:hypothetical protein [bacterium]MCB9478200.1 hypothetical protein [Deltaproteobacteria bacterium]MCB9487247.1 hypothetical protein [Deltaproteobacteria bacterium]
MNRQFRYKTVKRVREIRERLAQKELAVRARKVNEATEAIQVLGDRKQAMLDDVDRTRRDGFDLDREKIAWAQIGFMERQSAMLHDVRFERQQRLNAYRPQVMAAMHEREMMDKLEEDHRERVRLELSRDEERRLAEMAVQRYARKEKDR